MLEIFAKLYNLEKFKEGYNFAPCVPYSCPDSLRIERGICNALNRHVPATNGSWNFGSSICGKCGMYYGYWNAERREQVAAAINKLPANQQQQAAANFSKSK